MTVKNNFQKNYPFITCIKSNEIEYLGIVINADNQIISLYDFTFIKTEADKRKFLELGETWWWESNRKLPINIFLKRDMLVFKHCIKTFNVKDIKILFGPVINLSEIAEKRVKRRSIQLIRTVKKIKT
jgi:hypothetical protein